MATEDTLQEDKDKSFHGDNQGNNPIVNLQLSDKLKQKGVVQNIAVDRKASAIEVILNRGSKKTIVSTIYPNWNKTQNNFEKQANRKNLSKGDIVDIQDVLDDNHAIILQGILCNDANDKSAQSNNSQITDKKKQEIIDDIEKIRLDHRSITSEEWRNELEKKYQHIQDIVKKDFPSLWPALEFELSVQKILNIKGCTLPFAGIILGPPSSLKTQVIELLRKWPHTFYTDNFSAKSFVSHTTAVSREQLEQIDLLPKIKNKCFLTPELASTFAAKDDDLVQILGILTRILDGKGYESDSGAQGHRGYNGETMFVMVGAAVDIPYKVHKILGNLGSKLHFFRLRKVLKTEDDYLDQIKNDDFGRKMAKIGEALIDYIKWFEIGPEMEIDKESGLVKMPWNHTKNDETAQRYIIRLAGLLSHLRGVAQTWNTYGTQGYDYSYTLPNIEERDRAIQQLTNLARGHALLKGRNHITLDDIPLIIKVVLSTASNERVTIFDLLLAYNGVLTTSQIAISLNIALPTARRTMLELKVLRLVDSNDNSTEDNNSIKHISLRKEFEWFLSEEFRSLWEEFKTTDDSESPDENGVKEKLPLSSKENFNSGLDVRQDKKENDKSY
jgi:hypothetical protein